ncbi:BREX-2 system adenine-specific DNA-methyltransferase PglX [Nocardia sp. NPDC049737]|uniref:BREX-2 system adenine-specific DNA-methyltransferase PglX n=1 Tax=Nocardia sp. NPDC049737 TaxID=3154358 RepID=UPI003448F0D7
MAGTEGFSASALVAALRKQVTALEDDLRTRVDGTDLDSRQPGVFERWKSEYEHALTAQRTAASWQEWRNERVTQSAVAWVLLTVFARYCEDNALVSRLWIAGPNPDARQQALDARRAYFTEKPEHTDREWLSRIIEHFDGLEATRGLVDEFSPLHQVTPSGDAGRALLEFWWQKDDSGDPLWGFAGVDTRFLGDAYQDLSEYAKKTYALLQTPEFVEEFILDQTLEPALAERELDGFTVIDPTCGSGHFLLGAFRRLFNHWQREAPALQPRFLVRKALEGVFGVDINPFAVAIARFRLMVAALDASGDKSIEKLVDIKLNLAAGDSLLWGSRQEAIADDLLSIGQGEFALSIENPVGLKAILRREHDVVVGNPPYVSVKDPALRDLYRRHYTTCHGKYVLAVPFMELFFELAKSGTKGNRPGWVGQITANSFMKREFGAKLIDEFLGMKDLRRVIDTSVAFIPGHGTPTVILVARNQSVSTGTVRAVLGVRGEPSRPDEPAKGIVWSAIVDHLDDSVFDNGWITVADLDRHAFRKHPWSLSGGGAVGLLADIERSREKVLDRVATSVGITSFTLEDDVFIQPPRVLMRAQVLHEASREMVAGDELRDWTQLPHDVAIFPYGDKLKVIERDVFPVQAPNALRFMWPFRNLLENNKMFGNKTKVDAGVEWYEYGRLTDSKLRTPWAIVFAEVATHNHFVLDRGGKVFKQTAPVIKLSEGAGEDDHLNILGLLNSSVACFWLKQKCQNKAGGGIGRGDSDEGWEQRYQFNGTKVQEFPLPAGYPLTRARTLDALGVELAKNSPEAVAANAVPTDDAVSAAYGESERIRALMIALQEELDWECYRLYGLVDEDLTYPGNLPGIALGERAFEIVLAKTVENGVHTVWFERHRSTRIADIPAHLPADYQALMQRRLDTIASNPNIRLLEKPEYKRRWTIESWDKRLSDALCSWLLDRVEDRTFWFDRDGRPTMQSVAQLADNLDHDEDFRKVLQLWAGSSDVSTSAALTKLLADEGVPYLAALRYKSSGLDKRVAWEETWALQRREDAGEKLDIPIAVPPKYRPTDFAKPAYWSRRGKLDVPKERFISYPGASRESDSSELLGWAGWDHGEQALALAELIGARIDDGWEAAKLAPMLAGLAELAPWVRQWHGEIDPEYGESVAHTIDEELRSRCAQVGVTIEELAAWRPPATTRGRGPGK